MPGLTSRLHYCRMIAGTLQTDPRSGGIKRSSGVQVLPEVAEAWKQVRDNQNSQVDWVLLGYEANSKTNITLLQKGEGGIESCTANLLESDPCFGGVRLANGRFVGFYFAPENASAMKKGRASMHKNGVLNVLEGRDGEIQVHPNMKESEIGKIF